MTSLRVAVTADHNGLALKADLAALITRLGHRVEDRGAHVRDGEVVDYPALCLDVCRQVQTGAADRAVVVGGSGQGEAIACNKLSGIRAGLCQDVWSTGISRGNNDSNVLVLGAKVIDTGLARQIVEVWLRTPFKGGVHQRRIDQIAELERDQG